MTTTTLCVLMTLGLLAAMMAGASLMLAGLARYTGQTNGCVDRHIDRQTGLMTRGPRGCHRKWVVLTVGPKTSLFSAGTQAGDHHETFTQVCLRYAQSSQHAGIEPFPARPVQISAGRGGGSSDRHHDIHGRATFETLDVYPILTRQRLGRTRIGGSR